MRLRPKLAVPNFSALLSGVEILFDSVSMWFNTSNLQNPFGASSVRFPPLISHPLETGWVNLYGFVYEADLLRERIHAVRSGPTACVFIYSELRPPGRTDPTQGRSFGTVLRSKSCPFILG